MNKKKPSNLIQETMLMMQSIAGKFFAGMMHLGSLDLP